MPLTLEYAPDSYNLAAIAQRKHGFWARRGTTYTRFCRLAALVLSILSTLLQIFCAVNLAPRLFNLTEHMEVNDDYSEEAGPGGGWGASFFPNAKAQTVYLVSKVRDAPPLFRLSVFVGILLMTLSLLAEVSRRANTVLLYHLLDKGHDPGGVKRRGDAIYWSSWTVCVVAFLTVPLTLSLGSLGLILRSETAVEIVLNCVAAVSVTDIDELIVLFYFRVFGYHWDGSWKVRFKRRIKKRKPGATVDGGKAVANSWQQQKEKKKSGENRGIAGGREEKVKVDGGEPDDRADDQAYVETLRNALSSVSSSAMISLSVVPLLMSRLCEDKLEGPEGFKFFWLCFSLVYLGVFFFLNSETLASVLLLPVLLYGRMRGGREEWVDRRPTHRRFASLCCRVWSSMFCVSALLLFSVSSRDDFEVLSRLSAIIVTVPIFGWIIFALLFHRVLVLLDVIFGLIDVDDVLSALVNIRREKEIHLTKCMNLRTSVEVLTFLKMFGNLFEYIPEPEGMDRVQSLGVTLNVKFERGKVRPRLCENDWLRFRTVMNRLPGLRGLALGSGCCEGLMEDSEPGGSVSGGDSSKGIEMDDGSALTLLEGLPSSLEELTFAYVKGLSRAGWRHAGECLGRHAGLKRLSVAGRHAVNLFPSLSDSLSLAVAGLYEGPVRVDLVNVKGVSSVGWEGIGRALEKMSRLEEVCVVDCELSDLSGPPVFRSLPCSLKFVRLARVMGLSGRGWEESLKALGRVCASNLRVVCKGGEGDESSALRLRLQVSELDDSIAPKLFGGLCSDGIVVEELGLVDGLSRLSDKGWAAVGEGLSVMPTEGLATMELNCTDLSDCRAGNVFPSLPVSLKRLKLHSAERLSEEGWEWLWVRLKVLTSLEELSIEECGHRLSVRSAARMFASLPASLCRLSLIGTDCREWARAWSVLENRLVPGSARQTGSLTLRETEFPRRAAVEEEEGGEGEESSESSAGGVTIGVIARRQLENLCWVDCHCQCINSRGESVTVPERVKRLVRKNRRERAAHGEGGTVCWL
uniref:Uncharacterized protein n=1 Tax=Chromera velia CCMP2878 TaxID=1169474 RepID=A0A0G4HQ60_9ALVE|eukprot:Cvel_30068.t1-p1 / transcript=Cvel_30068.t1 / gene=Cvel_30068 / organism=Chromera_velia_CCMP2878 / gene_product=hypothetical protein / transcript_product=hypothetical protein / location=Cvel_scaffold4231:3593-7043(+) / protein_length=1029 / sequence_SO=supercontig / SO=protein_coding / is_pseudo=false